MTQDEFDEWCEAHAVPWHTIDTATEQELTAALRWREESNE